MVGLKKADALWPPQSNSVGERESLRLWAVKGTANQSECSGGMSPMNSKFKAATAGLFGGR